MTIRTKVLALVAIAFSFHTAQATLKDINEQKSPFKLPALPYATNSLEAAIDAKTMELHHGKHHQAYVDNVNKALKNKKTTLLELLKTAGTQEPAVRNNAGGHWNHSFFWTVMSGKAEDQKMPERLEKEINAKWGSVDKFKEEFEKAGAGQFGSGWAWLIRTPAGLEITSTPNQDNPLMDVAAKKGTPIFGSDVWEHAYYLRYQNRRPEYLKSFWKVVNWKMVDQYDREASGTK